MSGVFLRPPSALQHHILCIICCGSDSAPECICAGRQHAGTVEHVALQSDCLDLNIDSPAPADCVTLNPQVLRIPFYQLGGTPEPVLPCMVVVRIKRESEEHSENGV